LTKKSIALSPLAHTWLIDLDGCVLEHNGHLRGEDVLLPGVREFWQQIPDTDVVILLTSRSEAQGGVTRAALQRFGLRYDRVIFGLPFGERVLINDSKPSGLVTALGISLLRDVGMTDLEIAIDPGL
jgi:hypothetical protein